MDHLYKSIEDHREILNDLFVAIQCIITGSSCITKSVNEDVLLLKIQNSQSQPIVLLMYDEHADIACRREQLHWETRKEEHLHYFKIPLLADKSPETNTLDIFVSNRVEAIYGSPSQTENENRYLIPCVNGKTDAKSIKDNGELQYIYSYEKNSEEPLNLGQFENPSLTQESSFSLSQLKYESMASDTPFFYCRFCGKSFAFLSSKEQHERMHSEYKAHNNIRPKTMHTGEKRYKCDYCEKSFNNSYKKKVHERGHTGEKPYICSYCNKGFKDATTLRVHERIHTGVQPYSCKYCGKNFTNLAPKNNHERIHEEGEPYKCDYCDRTFKYATNKKTHEKHHTGERPYNCKFCEKTFRDSYTKKLHERTHTGEKPYSCDYCEKTFITISHKRKHERVHTGDKPYICKYCPKTFTTADVKNEHEAVHANEKVHLCSYCNKTFFTARKKVRHERVHKRKEFVIVS